MLNKHTQHVLVHTGQNYDYELNQIFFEQLGIQKPNHFLEAVGKSPAETIGNVISKTDLVLQQEAPDAVLVLGDTNSCLGVIAAKKRKIPIFHMEAGNRCFDQRVPEESNRKIVDHISDINLPYSDHAREYLLREGIPPDRVIKTGKGAQPDNRSFGNQLSARNLGHHTWAPMSPPLVVVLRNRSPNRKLAGSRVQ